MLISVAIVVFLDLYLVMIRVILVILGFMMVILMMIVMMMMMG